MSADRREVTLVLSAKNLGGSIVEGFGKAISGIGDAAEGAARKVGQGFENATSAVSNAFGNLTENLLSGGDLGGSFLSFGIYLGGQMAEGLVGQALEKMAGSTLVEALGGALAAAGSAIGGLLDAAIGIGMAALPVVLVVAIGAAVLYLINNPDVASKIADFAGGLVRGIVDGLIGLGGMLAGLFGKAWQLVVDGVGGFVKTIVGFWLGIPGALIGVGGEIVSTIIGGLASLPGKIADAVRNAFLAIDFDIGPFHIHHGQLQITLPKITTGGGPDTALDQITSHAGGGWAGLHGPELSWLGEKGPEYVASTDELRAGGSGSRGVTIEGVSESDLIDIVERGLFVRLRMAPAGT